MKGWELYKHIEEGGKIERISDGRISDRMQLKNDPGHNSLGFVLENPGSFKIVKPKKKIKLYRYTYIVNDTDDNFSKYEQSGWLYGGMKVCNTIVKTEEKEIEIDDNNTE